MTEKERLRLQPDERRKQILDIAVRLFGERGYADVSSSEIARAAGVTPALVHHYFGGKHEIYLAVANLMGDAAPDVIAPVQRGSLRTRISTDIDTWMNFVGDRRELWLATAGLGDAIPDPTIAEMVNDARERFVDRLLESYPERLSDYPAAASVLRSWLGFNQAVLRQWFRGEIDRAMARAMLVESLLTTIHTVVPAVAAQV